MQGIYLLRFAEYPQVYIGKSGNIQHRFSRHCYLLQSTTCKNNKLLLAYSLYGLPSLEILEVIEREEDLNSAEISWIEKLDSFKNGLNSTIGGEGSGSGELHIRALYSNEVYLSILHMLAETSLDCREISEELDVSYEVVSNILHKLSHNYLEDKHPNLYKEMLNRVRAVGGRTTLDSSKYIEILFKLANTDLPTEIISKELEVPLSIIGDIAKGHSHKYLKELFPIEYQKMISKKGKFTRGRKIWPLVKSPAGEILEVFNSSKFSKEHGLDSGGFSRLLNGKQQSQKGWTLAKI